MLTRLTNSRRLVGKAGFERLSTYHWTYAAVTGFFLFWVIVFSPYFADDAYITYREARNFSNGDGLVWNPGGERIDVSTTFLGTLFSAGAFLARIDPLVTSRVIGVLGILGAGVLSAILVGRVTQSRTAAMWCYAAILLPVPAAFQAIHGLWTGLFVFLVVSVVFVAHQIIALSPSRPGVWVWGLFGLCTLAGMSRPEGYLIAVATILYLISIGKLPLTRTVLSAAVFGFVAPTLLIIAGKWWYFGTPLPSSFYFKTSHGGLISTRAAEQFGEFFKEYSRPLFIIVAAFFGWRWRKIPTILWLILLLYLVGNAGYARFDLRMNISYRFFFQYYPLLVMLAAIGVHELLLTYLKSIVSRSQAVLLIAASLVILFLPVLGSFPRTWEYFQNHSWGQYNNLVRTGNVLQEYSEYNYRLALDSVGVVPYISDWWTIDIQGLATLSINRAKYESQSHSIVGTDEHRDIVFDFDPDVMIFSGVRSVDGPPDRVDINNKVWLASFTNDARMDQYQFVASVLYTPSNYFVIAVKKDNPHFEGLQNDLFALQTQNLPRDARFNRIKQVVEGVLGDRGYSLLRVIYNSGYDVYRVFN